MDKKDTCFKLIGKESGRELECPVLPGTEGASTLDIGKLNSGLGYFTFDPGFVSTASCESKITYIDGDRGQLQYRGYAIDQLAEQSHFVEVAYLIYYGELPNREQLEQFNRALATHGKLDKQVLTLLHRAFPSNAHPMSVLMASISYLAALYHKEKDIYDEQYREISFLRMLSKIAPITAWAFRNHQKKPLLDPNPELSFTDNFMEMMFGDEKMPLSKTFVRAMDLILLLHTDHEQNASTTTVRLAGSTETSPYAALTAGIAALWGPAHGGANEAVVKMLEKIVSSGKPIEHYIDRAKDKQDHYRLMGFGHRVYKNYDPRAKIIRKTCYNLLSELGEDNPNRPLLETAMKLEAIALEDEYFIERKLYPNVDFYSGIIFSAMKLPLDMYTAIFALSRTAGWLSHWNEMMSRGHVRIYRPRQLYTGSTRREYVPLERR